jgi:bla regulator protein blaR1
MASGGVRAITGREPCNVKGRAMERVLTLGLVNAASATVLAILATGLGRLLVRRPAAPHCLWLLVLLKLVTPPLFEVPILGRNSGLAGDEPVVVMLEQPAELAVPENRGTSPPTALGEDPVAAGLEEVRDQLAVEEPLWPRWRSTLVPWLGIAWLSGSAATLVLAAVRINRFRKLLHQAYPAPDAVQDQVRALSERLGLKRPPNTMWIDATLMPMLWAVACRPRLIIPRDLWKSLNPRQRSLLLAHELAHLRRGDHVIRLFELFVTALYWWLPVVWWVRSALRAAEEECCDAWVVWAFPEEARTYAETLLDTVDFLNPSRVSEPLLASGFGRAHHLRRRLTMIMLGTTPRGLGWASALGTISLSAVLLPLSPTWAQKPPEKPQAAAFAFEIKDDDGAKPSEISKSEVEFVIAGDGEIEQIQADSLEKAVDLINQRIEALAKQAVSDKQAAQVKALRQAVADLEKARAKVVSSAGSKEPAKKEERRIIVQRLEGGVPSKLMAEKKAQIDKARSRIDGLRKELDEKRQQLTNAQRDLEKLVTSVARLELRLTAPQLRIEKQPLELHATTVPFGERVIVNRRESAPESPDHPKAATTLSPSDKERLESLEKQLAKLLDEVASLEKHEEKAK